MHPGRATLRRPDRHHRSRRDTIAHHLSGAATHYLEPSIRM
jgi:hypothetical protein